MRRKRLPDPKKWPVGYGFTSVVVCAWLCAVASSQLCVPEHDDDDDDDVDAGGVWVVGVRWW